METQPQDVSEKAWADSAYYDYRIHWSQEDESFLGQCIEWGLTAHGESPEAAAREIRFLVAASIDWAIEDGEKYPEPISRRNFSGKFNVRMPAELHRRLVQEAEREDVSLNQWVITKLSGSL